MSGTWIFSIFAKVNDLVKGNMELLKIIKYNGFFFAKMFIPFFATPLVICKKITSVC